MPDKTFPKSFPPFYGELCDVVWELRMIAAREERVRNFVRTDVRTAHLWRNLSPVVKKYVRTKVEEALNEKPTIKR